MTKTSKNNIIICFFESPSTNLLDISRFRGWTPWNLFPKKTVVAMTPLPAGPYLAQFPACLWPGNQPILQASATASRLNETTLPACCSERPAWTWQKKTHATATNSQMFGSSTWLHVFFILFSFTIICFINIEVHWLNHPLMGHEWAFFIRGLRLFTWLSKKIIVDAAGVACSCHHKSPL